MTLSSFVDSPTFLDGLEISATDLNIMRRNAAIVDKISRRGKITVRSKQIHRKTNTMTNFDKVVEVYKAGLVIQAELARVKGMQSTLHQITDDDEYNTRYDEVEVLLDKALYASSDNAEELTKLANVMTAEEKAAFKAFRATQA